MIAPRVLSNLLQQKNHKIKIFTYEKPNILAY